MSALNILLTVGPVVGATIVLWVLAASLPNSLAWAIRRWFDVCARFQTNRSAVRERLSEVEGDFQERYEIEREDGSGATRATIRAFGFVLWEVLKAPAIAGAADRLVAKDPDHRKLSLRKLPTIIAKCLGIRGHYRPVTSLRADCPDNSTCSLSRLGDRFLASIRTVGEHIWHCYPLFLLSILRFSYRWHTRPNAGSRFLYRRIHQINPTGSVP